MDDRTDCWFSREIMKEYSFKQNHPCTPNYNSNKGESLAESFVKNKHHTTHKETG